MVSLICSHGCLITHKVNQTAAAVSAAAVPKGAMISKAGKSRTGSRKPSSRRAPGAASVTSGSSFLSSAGTVPLVKPIVCCGLAGFVATKPRAAVALDAADGKETPKPTVLVLVGVVNGKPVELLDGAAEMLPPVIETELPDAVLDPGMTVGNPEMEEVEAMEEFETLEKDRARDDVLLEEALLELCAGSAQGLASTRGAAKANAARPAGEQRVNTVDH